MPHVEITCISPGLREIIDNEAHHIKDPQSRKIFKDIVKELGNCEDGSLIGIKTGKHERTKRKLSAYNLFVQTCMVGGANDLKTCAAKWQQQKQSQ